MDPILIVVIIGVVGGAVKSVLGYVPNEGAFNWLRFLKTVLLSGIVGGAVVYFTKIQGVENVVFTTASYVEAFFISVGVTSAAEATVEAITKSKMTG